MRLKTILFVLLVISGCGYHFQGAGTVLPDDVRSIVILPVENDTTERGLSLLLREALSSEFERYGVVRIVEELKDADATLKSRIVKVETGVKNVTGSTDVELDLELTITLAAELRKKTGQVLWRNQDVKAADSFASVGDVVVTSSASFAEGSIGSDALSQLGSREVSRGQREEALSNLVDEVSRKIYLEAVAAEF